MSTQIQEPSWCHTVKSGLALVAPPQPVEFKTDPRLMCVDAVISSPALDRQGEILEPDGLVLGENGQPLGYSLNPVVLYDHRAAWPLPIGLAEGPDGICTVRKSDNRWISTNYFSQTCKFAENVFKLMDEGILRMWSVGFDPIDGTQIGMRPDGKHKAYRYTKWKLVEQSATPTAQNPEALTIFVQKSQPGALHPRLIESLKPFMVPGKATLLINAPLEKKSMDPSLPDGAAPPTDEPRPDGPPQEGKKLKPSARKMLDCIQQCSDLMLAWSQGWDDIEHEDIQQDVFDAIEAMDLIRNELGGSLDTHHEIKSDFPKVDLPGREKENESKREGEHSEGPDKPMGEKVDKDEKDEKEDYEKKFKKSILTVKGYNYVPQRVWLPTQKSDVEPKLSKEQEEEIKREVAQLQRELKSAKRLKERAALRLA